MYMQIIEKKPNIEHVNILGGRFIREAKVCEHAHTFYPCIPPTPPSRPLHVHMYTLGIRKTTREFFFVCDIL